MAVLIADCGSTKCDWRLVGEDGNVHGFRTEGINPSVDAYSDMLQKLSAVPRTGNVGSVFFYGAGVVRGRSSDAMRKALEETFPGAACEAYSDMTGAVRSMFGDGEGIAAIIGTGSNCALCRGGDVVKSVPSGGYVLGDEGSGAWIGRSLISDYVKMIMPDNIYHAFRKRYGLTYDDVVNAVYRMPNPNRFLASFAEFAGEFRDDIYVRNLLEEGFELFFSRNLMQCACVRCYPLRMTGSVACRFSEIVSSVAHRHGASVDRFVEAPVDGLVDYHMEKACYV